MQRSALGEYESVERDVVSRGEYVETPTHVRFHVLAVGCSLALLTYLHRQGFVGATPEIKDALHLNKEQMGHLASAFLLAYGLFQVPFGLIGDRFGARHLLTMLVVCSSLLTGLTALAAWLPPEGYLPFLFLLAIRFSFGVFQAGAFPVWARVMTDWMSVGERASGQGTIWMSSRLGGALSPFLFLGLYTLCRTWTIPLCLFAGLGLAWCAAFWPWFRNRPGEMPRVNSAERELIAAARDQKLAGSDKIPWLTILTSLNVWALCLMYGFVGFAGNFITNLLPMYLADERHLSAGLVKGLTSMPLFFGIASCVLGGLLSDWISRHWGNRKWGRRFNGSVGLSLAGLALLAVPWVDAVWLLGLLFSASFFCNDLNIGPAWAACADVGERYAGTISGAMNMIGGFGGAAGMSIAGMLLHRGHSTLVFVLFACSYGLAALCWMAIDVTRPLSTAETNP